ncbi:hypothetical protein Vi05172_g8747 [Venturia inaequalis]|nr:hypothetical protein Vi05172_g8747 [Venturia inaequalis]
MASTSTPVIAPHQNHLWNPSQPIRFAPTTRPCAGDKRRRAGLPLVFEDNIGTRERNARAFSATATSSQPVRGGRESRPSLASKQPVRGGRASRPSLASKGESPNDIIVRQAVAKIKKKALEDVEKKRVQKEVEKAAKQRADEVVRAAKQCADEVVRAAKQHADEVARAAKQRADEVARAAKQHADEVARAAKQHADEVERAAKQHADEVERAPERRAAEAERKRKRAYENERSHMLADLKDLAKQLSDIEQPGSLLKTMDRCAIRVKNLEQLVEKYAVQEVRDSQQTAETLAALIIVKWHQKRSAIVERKQEQTMPIFFRRGDVRSMIDRILLPTEAANMLNMSWRLVCAMVKIQRMKEEHRQRLASKRAVWERKDQLWAEFRSQWAMNQERHDTEDGGDDDESTPGYMEYARPMKEPMNALFDFWKHFEVHHKDMSCHLDKQRKKWHDNSVTLHSLRGDILEEFMSFEAHILKKTGDNSRLINLQHLVDSVETALADIIDDLTLFAAAFKYEYLRLNWHWQKFGSTVDQVGKIGHQARQQGLLRMQFASSEPHVRMLARMRSKTKLLHPLRSSVVDWGDMQMLTDPIDHWFPPSTFRQMVDVKKYVTHEDFDRANMEAVRTKFGSIFGELYNLASYAAAASQDGLQEFTFQNRLKRLLVSEFSKESSAHQSFFIRLQPLLDHHAQVVADINQCIEALENLVVYAKKRVDSVKDITPHSKLVLSLEMLRLRKDIHIQQRTHMKHLRTEWMNKAFGDINEIGRMTYKKLNQPSYADRLAKDAPRLDLWFVRELGKDCKNRTPTRAASERADIARRCPRMMDELDAIERGLQLEAAEIVSAQQSHSEREHHPEQVPISSPSLWRRIWGKKEQSVEAEKKSGPKRASILAPREKAHLLHGKRAKLREAQRHYLSQRHQKERASKLRDTLAKDLEPSSNSLALITGRSYSDGPEMTRLSSVGQRSAQIGDHVYQRLELTSIGGDVDGRDVDGRDVDGRDVDGRDVDGRDVDGEVVDRGDVDGRDNFEPMLDDSDLPLPNKEGDESPAYNFSIDKRRPSAIRYGTAGADEVLPVDGDVGRRTRRKNDGQVKSKTVHQDSKAPRPDREDSQRLPYSVKVLKAVTTAAVGDMGPQKEGFRTDKRRNPRRGPRNVILKKCKSSPIHCDEKSGKTGRITFSPTHFSFKPSDEKSEKTGRITFSPTHFSFKPSDPKHAPYPTVFGKDPPSSGSFGHQSDPSPNNASPEADRSEADSAFGEDLSDAESGSEIGSASEAESDSDNDSVSSSDADCDASSEDETYTPLNFQIPADAMREAMLASPGTPASFWSHKLYRGPADEKVTVHYCRSKETGETVAKLFLGKPVLGFDIEWKPQANAAAGLKRNVSLIQLACEDRVGLFHIALYKGNTPEEVLPPTLRAIMESPDVMKTGVATQSDFSRVAKFLDTSARGVIELSHWHRLITYSEHNPKLVNKRLVSLAIQVETHLQLPLSKGDVRTSDWSKQLNHEQCSYAAADAYASYRLYEALEEKRIAMNPRPPRPQFAELKMPIKLATRVVAESSSDEDPADTVDEAEAEELTGGLENLTLGSSNQSLAMDENITDEELLAIESATQGPDVGDLTQETSDIVKYPELPPFDDYTESAPARLVGRVRLASTPTTTTTKPKASRKPRTPKSTSTLEQSELLAAATTWADSHINPTPSSDRPHHRDGRKGGTTWLKCYYLWHHGGLEIDQVAKIVRDPALKRGTVASYIAEAVGYGGCEMGDLERLRKVLDLVPMQAWGRFRKLRKEVEEGLAGGIGGGGRGKEGILGDTDANGEGKGDDWVV